MFNLGQVVATQGAMESLTMDDITNALTRYVKGDWGNICEEDAELNDRSVKTKDRILASYASESGVNFWVITDAYHEVTTILLPSEY